MTANLGHGLREIADKIADQAATVAFTFRNQFSNVAAEKLARKLCELAPGDLDRAFFVNSGSEASEYAIRMSLHYWKERGHAAPELATLPRIERFPTTEKAMGTQITSLRQSGTPVQIRAF
jgi:adenosylmethionine-8-amino-7-oxononanoate aminotransferase